MIRKGIDCEKEYREQMRGGDGVVEITDLASPAELNEKGRLFAKITLKQGCSIGFHMHEKESELFYIIAGEAEYNDNGVQKTVCAGDVTICAPGTGHGIANKQEEAVELLAVILHA